jgi:hypothetical protein
MAGAITADITTEAGSALAFKVTAVAGSISASNNRQKRTAAINGYECSPRPEVVVSWLVAGSRRLLFLVVPLRRLQGLALPAVPVTIGRGQENLQQTFPTVHLLSSIFLPSIFLPSIFLPPFRPPP